MFRKLFPRIVSAVVVVSMLLGPIGSSVQAAQIASANAKPLDPSTLPDVIVPNPVDRIRPYLPNDPQAQTIDDALGESPTTAWEEVLGLPSQEQPPFLPTIAQPQLPNLTPELPEAAPPTMLEPAQPDILGSTKALFLGHNASTHLDEPRDETSIPALGAVNRFWLWVKRLFERQVAGPELSPQAGLVEASSSGEDTVDSLSGRSVLSNNAGSQIHTVHIPLVMRGYTPGMITSTGGEYVSPDGLVTVRFPPNAVSEPVKVSYTRHSIRDRQLPTLPGAFTLKAHTTDEKIVSPSRPVVLELPRSPSTYGPSPSLYWWDESRFRWVSIGIYTTWDDTETGQANVVASVTDLGTYALMPNESVGDLSESSGFFDADTFSYTFASDADDEEDPDDGEDGFVITQVCWQPGVDLEHVVVETTVYTTTEEADPWAGMWLWWENEDEEIEYDSYFWEERNFTNEPEVTITLEEAGPYSVGRVLSYTILAGDLYEDGDRYDFDEGALRIGTQSCVEGGSGCERIPPTIEYVDIWQSGTGFSVVTVVVSDNFGEPTVELVFNGQYIAMTPMGGGIFEARVDYSMGGVNNYQVKATDTCGNYTIFPGSGPITAAGSSSGTLGWSACKPTPDGACLPPYQGVVGDPVNTATGNFMYRSIDATAAGLGGTTLALERAHNSMAAAWAGASVMRFTDDGDGGANDEMVAGPPQYFGPGWSFPFGAYLLVIDKPPFYQGVQIQYADGRTVLFADNGDGTYAADSVRNFDTLTREDDEFVLRHKYTLEAERFDADGQLIAIEDRNGNVITFTYDDDRLTRVKNASGRWMEFTYNVDGLIAQVSMPEDVNLYYEYIDGLLTAFINGRGKRTEYYYSDEGQLTEVVTPKGHPSLRVEYEPDTGRTTQQIVGEGELHEFTYNEDGSTTTLTDAYGAETVHHYDEQARLVRIDYPDGIFETFGYNDDFIRIYHRNQCGEEWHWTYDNHGNKRTEDGPLGWHREWEYNDLNRITHMVERVDENTVRETTFDYDERGNMTEICNPLDDCSTMEYDERGLLTDVYDFAHNHTHNTYDAEGDLIAITNAEDETTHFDHDDLGRMVEMQTPLGYTYTYAYDPNDNLVAVDGPLGYHLGYRYDDSDNLELEIDLNGGEIHYDHDKAENVISVTNQLDYTAATYTYGRMNELTGFKDAEGRTWTYEHDKMLRVTDIYGPMDTHTHFDRDAVGNVTDVTDPENHVTHTEYDALNRPIAVTLNYRLGEPESADTNVTTIYEYDLLGNVLRVVDPEGNPTEYEYDLLGQAKLMRDAEGQEWEYEYDPMGNMTLMVNPRGYPTAFEYDGVYRLTKIVDADGNITTFEYDDDGNMTDEVDPLGVVTHYVYNELDRPVQEIRNYRPGEPEDAEINVTTEYEYDLAGNLRFTTDPRDYRSEFCYDAAHRLVETIDYQDAHTSFDYDRVDNLLAITDDNNHTTSYTYDHLDHRKSVTNAEGHTITFSYDKVGNLTDMVDANGNPTHYDVDALGRVVRMIDALDGEWSYEYDRVGNVLVETDANGHPTSYTYDKVYRLLSTTDAEDHISRLRWDKNGNLVEFIDGNGHSTGYAYDALDRLSAMTNAEDETTEYRYDPLGNQTHLIEADGIVTRYGYDPLYRLNAVTQNYVAGGPSDNDTNVVTHYTYDPSGNLAEIINANGAVTTFDHDGMDRLVREVDPLGNTWEYTYDGVGNRLTRLDANGALTTYSYHRDDQLKRIDYKDGTFVEYNYDPSNNRTSMVDWLGTTTWTYDELDRVIGVVDPFDRTLHYEYDPVDNRVEMVYPDGNLVAYTYYKNDWLKTMVDPEGNVTSYARDGVGNITQIVNPNSTITDIACDKADRVLTLTNRQTEGAGKTNSAFAYTYNEVGHVTQVVNEYGWRNPPVVTETYGYDGLHRLIGMENSDGVVMTYSYDPVGNRLTWETDDDLTTQTPLDGFSASYTYNAANQLRRAAVDSEMPNGDLTIEFAYDANGNRIDKLEVPLQGSKYGTAYSYDYENRLVVVQDYQLVDHDNHIDRAITTLEYDGGGRRLVKTYDPKTGSGGQKRVEYVFDGLDPVAEYEMLNGQRDNYYRGAMDRIATRHHFPAGAEGQMYWYHYNFKGDVVGLTKHHGQSTHNYRYDPYGGVVPAHGNFTDPHNHYTLTGKEYDEHTGLVYFGARHYDPESSIWTTQDIYRGILERPDSLRRNAYLESNPINYVDLTGYRIRRNQITEEGNRGYLYTCNCGWIDWSHFDLSPNSKAAEIYQEVQERNNDPLKYSFVEGLLGYSFKVELTLEVKLPGTTTTIVVQRTTKYVGLNKSNLSSQEEKEIALGIFQRLEEDFEERWAQRLSGSSYSEEDLMSNLLSFYAAIGYTLPEMKDACQALSAPQSREVYDWYQPTVGFEKRTEWGNPRLVSPPLSLGSYLSSLYPQSSSIAYPTYTRASNPISKYCSSDREFPSGLFNIAAEPEGVKWEFVEPMNPSLSSSYYPTSTFSR